MLSAHAHKLVGKGQHNFKKILTAFKPLKVAFELPAADYLQQVVVG